MDNPLLELDGLPPFSKITPEIIEPAIDALLQQNREAISTLLDQLESPSWETLIEPIELLDDRLSRAWSPVKHMNAVVNSDALRKVYNSCLPKLSAYSSELAQNKRLYEAYKKIEQSEAFATMAPEKKAVIEHALKNFHLGGVDLPEEDKNRFRNISQRLSELASRFSENILDATHAWEKHVTDPDELSGMTESGLALARQAAQQKELDGWLLTLDFPSYHAVMAYADSRALREEMYQAYVTRASELSNDGKFDNSALMEEIIALRHEQASLLGFSNYAERSLAKKMADNPREVMDFLHKLAAVAKPIAENEFEDLKRFAAGVLGVTDVQAWDIAYISEKMKGAYFNLSQEELKPYFPVDRVISGIFRVAENLFGITITERKDVDVWHPDVRFYEVRDTAGELRAQFYFDLYARPRKRGGAWMDVCISRMLKKEGLQVPVAYMTCNSAPPIGEQPALLTHNEVVTLFHEFGHGLHHMLTRVDYPEISGIAGVEWDAVELPSQFMENFCWEREALDLFAEHYESGKKLPDDLYQRMLDSRHFQAATQLLRQLEFAMFDMRIHQEYDADKGARIAEVLSEVRDEVSVLKPPDYNRFQHSFSHIFAGGYAAGYYSYKWAEVLSADAFSRFEEEGIFNHETGTEFLREILEVGGSRPAKLSFEAFRGRPPRIEPLLKHAGLLQ